MRKVCAWCGKNMSSGRALSEPDGGITHGLCADCADNLICQMGVPLRQYLDSLAAPILLVDYDCVVKTTNKEARAMLGKELPDTVGFRGGDVFECAYARLPGGCGNTIHCSGCTIRQTVTETFSTGHSLLRVPAYLKKHIDGGSQDIQFLISTEKIKDLILLRIDEIREMTADNRLSPS